MASMHTTHGGDVPHDFPQRDSADDARRLNTDNNPISPGDIAVGVVIGRASEYFDFFVYAIASVLVFP
ncbi:MFS transporter, partial [Pseudoduganella sp. RAF53_2]